jgi:hypothetical protein
MDPSLLRALFTLDYVRGEVSDYSGGPLFASAYLANNGLAEDWGEASPVVVEDGAWVLHFSSGVILRARPGEPVTVTRPSIVVAEEQPQDPAEA